MWRCSSRAISRNPLAKPGSIPFSSRNASSIRCPVSASIPSITRVTDHLAVEAIEVDGVPGFVGLLGGEEGGLGKTVVSGDQRAQRNGDLFLADEERRSVPQQPLA